MRIPLSVAMAALVAQAALAQPKDLPKEAKSEQVLTLGQVDGEADAAMSVVTVRLSDKPGFATPELKDHGSFLQMVLPGTIVPEPGKFYDGAGPYVKKLAVFQLTPNDAAVRIFVARSAAEIRKHARIETLGKRIVMTLDHGKLEEELAASAKVAATTQPTAELEGPPASAAQSAALEEASKADDPRVEAESIIASTKQAGAQAPAELIKGLGVGTNVPDLREKLVDVTIFGAALLVLCGLTWFLRPYLKRRGGGGGAPEATVKMKTIATLPLAPKQKLSLVQVGDEKILIGVTPEHVSYITTLGAFQGTNPLLAQLTRAAMVAPAAEIPAPAMPKMKAPAPIAAPVKPARSFAQHLAEGETSEQATVELRRPERPKAGATAKPAPKARTVVEEPRAPEAPMPRRRIAIGVGDDGIIDKSEINTRETNVASARTRIDRGSETQKAIDDVTRLIREKLKTLKTI